MKSVPADAPRFMPSRMQRDPAGAPPSSRLERFRVSLLAPWRKVRGTLRKVLREHASPNRLGVAVALGVVVGSSPFFGLHLVISVGLAMLFRLNRAAVLLGSQVSAPPLTPFLVLANAQLGEWILHRHWLPTSFAAARGLRPNVLARELFADLALGGLVTGIGLGLIFGLITANLARRSGRRESLRQTR